MANYTQTGRINNAKALYLLLLASGLFFIENLLPLALLAGLQTVLWLQAKLPFSALFQALLRLQWFFLLVILSYLLIQPYPEARELSFDVGWLSISLYPQGLETAILMLSRVGLLVFTSLWVRLSLSTEQFVQILQHFLIPKSVAIVIDAGLSLATERGSNLKARQYSTGSTKDNRKGGKGGRNKREKITVLFADLRQGNFGFLDDLLDRAMRKSEDFLQTRYPNMQTELRHDAGVILAVVVAVMSLKLLQLLPGLPFAPGHKNLIVIPLLIMASISSHGRYGGLAAGFSVGIVSFLMGYGKFGVFEILHFALPGLVADVLVPLLTKGAGFVLLLRLALLGALIGLTRFAANFMILLLIGSPALAWVVFLPMLLSQLVFGSLSSIVAIYIVKKYKKTTP